MIFQPQSYGAALFLTLLSMVCWGSWANTMKLTKGWPFQAYYWDYVVGILIASVLFGAGFGGGGDFFLRLSVSRAEPVMLALAGGAIFNCANILLVAAIEIAGMAVAFPVGIGLALVVGVALNYLQQPAGNPGMLGAGIVLVLIAILLSARAHRLRGRDHGVSGGRGVLLSVVAGCLMGIFYPFVARSLRVEHPLDAYTVTAFFALGVCACAVPLNAFLMRRPITDGGPVAASTYLRASGGRHAAALLGGVLWTTGAEANFVASQAHIVGPAISYALGQGATLISAIWGVFVWKEFAGAPKESRRLLAPMFLAFLSGLALIAAAPLYR